MADASAPVFLDDLLGDYFEKLGADFRKTPVAGQVCVASINYTYENQILWRPDGYDGTQTTADVFRQHAAGQDAYNRPKALITPKLEINEEFPVVRAKRRPAILLRPAPLKPTGTPSKQFPELALVLPMYSVADPAGNARHTNDFLVRVRRLEFPEFFFLTQEGAAIQKDSLLPIFRLTNVFQAHLDLFQWKLVDPVLRILQGQVRFALTGDYAGEYQNAREMLLNP
jgi:hypothetical protein